jgi:hypothetical protein
MLVMGLPQILAAHASVIDFAPTALVHVEMKQLTASTHLDMSRVRPSLNNHPSCDGSSSGAHAMFNRIPRREATSIDCVLPHSFDALTEIS